jgi:hypothetical protein
MRHYFNRSLGFFALAASLTLGSTSCNKDLDQTPEYLASNPDLVYKDPAQVYQILARIYATYAISGQVGPAGNADISGIDEGFSNYIRQYWQLQEITTDEAIIGWNDGSLPTLNTNTWNADNEFVRATFQRIYYQIGLCNELIRQTTDAQLAARGVSEVNAQTIRQYRAEARLMRALSYWHAIDLFGGGPFITETDELSIKTVPAYKKGSDMFTYVESELKDLDASNVLLAPRAVYARADRAMCWTLLSKLYLNAKVYTGTDRSSDALIYADKVLTQGGYSLAPTYANLFLADNDQTSANEAIFAITFDGINTQNYGGMTYLVHAPVGRAVPPASAGIGGGWAGLRTKPNLVNLFPGGATGSDARQALFFTKGQNPNVDTLTNFSSGVLVTKFRNVTSTGAIGKDPTQTFPDTDFFMFRLADVKLMYAEALLRGATGGTSGTALAQVNQVRARSGAAALPTVTLNDILNERGRELFWEGHRRTDLIRFGKYTTGYNWPFKGNVVAGKDIEAFRTIFPIPNTERVVNTNLPQNPGY